MTIIQIKRGDVPGVSPTGLAPGELAVEMATPTRLWVGVPPEIDPAEVKLLTGGEGSYLPLSGGVLTGNLDIGDGTGNPVLNLHGGTAAAEGGRISLQKSGVGKWSVGFKSAILGTVTSDNFMVYCDAVGSALDIDSTNARLILAGDPIDPLHAATKQYVDIVMSTLDFLSSRGGTMRGYLTLEKEAPVYRAHAANKGYVDDVAGGVVQRVNEKLSKKGDVMRGMLTLWGTPVIDMHATPKKYVDDELKKALDRIAALEAKLGK